jgi:hypothetical protein
MKISQLYLFRVIRPVAEQGHILPWSKKPDLKGLFVNFGNDSFFSLFVSCIGIFFTTSTCCVCCCCVVDSQ